MLQMTIRDGSQLQISILIKIIRIRIASKMLHMNVNASAFRLIVRVEKQNHYSDRFK